MQVILNLSLYALLTKKKTTHPNDSCPITVETTKSPQKYSCQSIVSQCANGKIPFLNPPII